MLNLNRVLWDNDNEVHYYLPDVIILDCMTSDTEERIEQCHTDIRTSQPIHCLLIGIFFWQGRIELETVVFIFYTVYLNLRNLEVWSTCNPEWLYHEYGANLEKYNYNELKRILKTRPGRSEVEKNSPPAIPADNMFLYLSPTPVNKWFKLICT